MQVDAATFREDMRKYGALRFHYDPFGTGARIGTVNLPNFKTNNEGYTKTEPTRSDEEILNDIAELAKRHAEKGTFHNMDNEYLDLMKEYISSVSPDRESILKNALQEIFTKANLPKKEKKDPLGTSILQETLKAMEQAKNKKGNMSNDKRIWLDGEISGATYNVGAMNGNEIRCASFGDGNETIAAYDHQNGWSLFDTKAELARRQELTAVYNEAFNSVYNAQNASMSKSLTSGNTLDVVG